MLVVVSLGQTYITYDLRESLTKMVNNPHLHKALLLQNRERRDNVVDCLYNSPGWVEKVYRSGWSAPGRKDLVLALCCDAFAPFDKSSYSILPLVVVALNLPESIRFKPENMIVVGIVQGPKTAETLQPYLHHFVDQLLDLDANPINRADGGCSKVKLLLTVNDYPGHGKVNLQQVQGSYYGCIKCEFKVTYT